jgi:hypothetical protein
MVLAGAGSARRLAYGGLGIGAKASVVVQSLAATTRAGEGTGIPWAAFCDAVYTVAQGLELLFDYASIHACLRSARMRSR